MWSQRRASFPHTSSRPIDFSYFFQIKNQNIFKHEKWRMYLTSSRLVLSSFSGDENNNNHYHYHNKKSDRDAKELVSNATLRIPRQRLNRPTERLSESSLGCTLATSNLKILWCDAMRGARRKGEKEKGGTKDDRRRLHSLSSDWFVLFYGTWNDLSSATYSATLRDDIMCSCELESALVRVYTVAVVVLARLECRARKAQLRTLARACVGCDCQVTRDVFSSHHLFVFLLYCTIF